MELRLLQYFLAVVEAGSLRTAAARLHLAQPSLSAAMARLESDLGVELLSRGPHGSEPTAAGRYLVEAATRLLSDADDARRTLARFAAGTRGTLSLAAVPALMWHRMPQVLRDLGMGAEDVDVSLVEAAPWTALDLLHTRTVDVAAILVAEAAGFADRHRSDLRVIDAGDVPLVLALPPGEDATPSAVSVRTVVDRPFLLPRRTPVVASLPEVVDRYFADHLIVPERSRTVETIQTALALVSAGLGVAIVPDADGASLSRFEVVARPLDPAPPMLRAVYVARAEHAEGAVARFLHRVGGEQL